MSRQRYFIEISYDGGPFNGWQIQPNGTTVQQKLDEALSTIFREKIETLGCGRTDTGVHASQFYAHFDREKLGGVEKVKKVESVAHDSELRTQDSKLIRGINAILPYEIAAKQLILVHENAHARFDAAQRSYAYYMHFEKNPFLRKYSWLYPGKPNVNLMNEAAAILKGYTDFSCFSKSNTQTFTNNCSVKRAEWVEENGQLIFHITADRFLRNMVRAIVGTLVEIGMGKLPVEAMHEIIASKKRSEAGVSVPACGLFLTEVKYPYL